MVNIYHFPLCFPIMGLLFQTSGAQLPLLKKKQCVPVATIGDYTQKINIYTLGRNRGAIPATWTQIL